MKAASPKGNATRDRIVAAALETVRAEGFANTTARAIAAHGGFNQALIFAGLNEKDRAFEALDRGATAGPFRIGRILTWPELALLRSDPRVIGLWPATHRP